MNGEQLPQLVTSIPGPASRQLAVRLRRVESRNITAVEPTPPIFWQQALGANVRDVDGNVYIDLTSGFGVANAGHSNPVVARAIATQAATLAHALGDVYPADIKVLLLERLAQLMPAPLRVSILANSGAEAVEAALKTAVMHTGRTGILAFNAAYHGLSYGALSVTQRAHFREPFEHQLFQGVHFAPFPDESADAAGVLAQIDAIIARADNSQHPIGCIIVEPIQGRGGIVVPPTWFLRALRERCDGSTRILIFDEVYVGVGRTGRWLASEHWQVVPDIAVIGKGLSGALPLSAAVGSAEVMNAWPASTGEAIHTSTFIGNPIACAAAIAQLNEIEQRGLLDRARVLGERIAHRTARWQQDMPAIVATRGIGLIQAVVLPHAEHAAQVVQRCLQQGVLLLMEGTHANVLALTPPAVITETQLDYALDVIEYSLPFGG
ncbi:MAG TPA: aspartate aminotransferase family protein [Longimicrobiales bacterium]|nr:aspartate aminotransferase family protein [Longimicrobiales bacterium]